VNSLALRQIVGRWLRIRAQHVHESIGISGSAHGLLARDEQERVLLQLAVDAEHSDLLLRLFDGGKPLSWDDWQRREGDTGAAPEEER
jgi:hypothetical protein